jgi:hypothetical protein
MNVQSGGKPNFRNYKTPNLGVSEKCHLNVAMVACHKEYYKGEGGDLPQVRAMMSLVSPCMFMIHPCTKNVPTMH